MLDASRIASVIFPWPASVAWFFIGMELFLTRTEPAGCVRPLQRLNLLEHADGGDETWVKENGVVVYPQVPADRPEP